MPKIDQHAMDHTCLKGAIKIYKIIPGSSKCVFFFAEIHQTKTYQKGRLVYISRRCRYIMLACWSVDCLSSFHPISRLVLVPDSKLFIQNSTIPLQDLGVMRTTSDSSKSLSTHLYVFIILVYNKVYLEY